ncbi:Crp/Fnr family transcriptional regulator [Myxococcota bacterium]
MEALRYLVKSDLFGVVPNEELKVLAEQSEVRFVDAGDLVVRFGAPADRIIFLADGKLAIYRRNKKRGVALLLGILDAPSLFGDAEFAAGAPWMASARAEVDACCIMIPGAAFMKMVDRHAELASHLYRDASIRHLLAHHTAQTVALYGVETRLLRLLLDYAFRYGERVGNDVRLTRSLSQVEIAAALGVTRKTVARTLRPMEEKGTISRESSTGMWTIHGVDKLQETLPKHLFGVSSRLRESPASVISRWTDALYSDDTD